MKTKLFHTILILILLLPGLDDHALGASKPKVKEKPKAPASKDLQYYMYRNFYKNAVTARFGMMEYWNVGMMG